MKASPLFSLTLAALLAWAAPSRAVTFTTSAGGEAIPASVPSDAESLGRLLCSQIDLGRPGLEEVKKLAGQGQYARALSAWRDAKIDALRKADLGGFNWHGDQLNGGRLHAAEFLAGRMDEAEYERLTGKSPFAFRDLFGLRGDPARPIHTDWLAKDAQGRYSGDYMNFYFGIPFAVRYWQSGDDLYLRKWFQIAADFALTQKRAVEALDAPERKQVPCNWSRDAQAALSQGDRVQAMIRTLGVFAKSLPGSGRPAKWDDVYRPAGEPAAAADRELIPPVELAQIALSLVNDHPAALLERYSRAGAVPNQRRNGLAAVLLTAQQFPEFTASAELFQRGSDGLKDYLQGAFHQDGGMLEQSFNYNLGDARSLALLAESLRPSAPDLARALDERYNGFARVMAGLATPLVAPPAMSSYSLANPPALWADPAVRGKWLAAQREKLPATDDPLATQIYGQFAGEATQPGPAFTSIAFPYSGYYAQRRDWRWDSPYLFLQDCRPGRGHRTMGHNALQLIAYGRPMLVTSGVPVYTPGQLPPELRPEIKAINELLGEHTSWKANTILVDGQSQNADAPVAQTAHATPIERRWLTGPEFDFMEGVYDLGYPRPGEVDHRREVIFVRDPGFWIVTDFLTNRDRKEHAFTQVWNFYPFKEDAKNPLRGFANEQVKVDAATRAIHTSDPDGPNLWLWQFGAPALDYVKHYGEKTPWLGWYAIGFGNLTPAPAVTVRWKSPAHSVVVTLLWPVPGGKPPGVAARDLSPKNDPAQAAFSLQLADGRVLTYQAAHDQRPLSIDGLRVEARGLLTVQSPGGVTRGLVMGRKGNATPPDFQFARQGGQISDLTPMTVFQGFRWEETPGGIKPAYTPR